MALPSLAKTWSFDVNNATLGGGTSWQPHWLQLKNKLVGFGHGWVVAGSGGAGAGGGGGMDATDRWVIAGDITIGSSSTTTGNSWIVLQNDNIATGFQLLMTPSRTGGGWESISNFRVSPGGNYTGGGQTTCPTATDEITVVNNETTGVTNGPTGCATHLWMSADGECTRILFTQPNVSRSFLLIDKAANTVSGWTIPWVALGVFYGSSSVVPQYADLYDVDTYAFSSVSGTTMKLFCTAEAFDNVNNAAVGQRLAVANSLDSNGYHLGAIGLASQTVGLEGRHGELQDLWWTATVLGEADYFPSTLPRQFVVIGDLVLPWDQTAGALVF